MSKTTEPSRPRRSPASRDAYPRLAPTLFELSCETVASYDSITAQRLAAYHSLGLDILNGPNKDDFLVAILCGDELAARKAASPKQLRFWRPLKAALDEAMTHTFSTAKGSRERIEWWVEIGGLTNVVHRACQNRPKPPAPR